MRVLYHPSNDPRVTEFNLMIAKKFPHLLKENNPELILVAGGDGTMLSNITAYHKYEVPFFGIAKGTLNFLLNHVEDDEKVIEDLLHDRVNLFVLHGKSISVRKNIQPLGFAVNEVVVGDSINGYHQFCITTHDKSFENFILLGAGLCVSTAIGSTGYNFNNGGPVIPTNENVWAMTDIVCNRNINDLISAQEIMINSKSSVNVFIDGQKSATLHQRDVLHLETGPTIELAFLSKDQFIKQRIELSHRSRG